MATLNDELPTPRDGELRHYWLREDFDHLMSLIGAEDFPVLTGQNSGTALVYPKTTEGAVMELRTRGLKCDRVLLTKLVEDGILNPRRGHLLTSDDHGEVKFQPISTRILYWDKEAIDYAAEWLYQHDYWESWTHFCWVANLRFGQAVKAHRVACARYGLGFHTAFDIPGFLTIIEPTQDATLNYATVSFYPDTMKAEVTRK